MAARTSASATNNPTPSEKPSTNSRTRLEVGTSPILRKPFPSHFRATVDAASMSAENAAA
jgi:hypothetical protein